MENNNKYSEYTEDAKTGNKYRSMYKNDIVGFINKQREKADKIRAEYFKPDTQNMNNYIKDIGKYREDFKRILGYPLINSPEPCAFDAEEIFVASDGLADIYRYRIQVLDGVKMYGILLRRKASKGRVPLVITQHGGGGTAEIICSLYECGGYSRMARKLLEKADVAIFAPQLLLYLSEECGEIYNRFLIDAELKHMGSSIDAVEAYGIMRIIDFFSEKDFIDENRIGMQGLSYGGHYTLEVTALDERIKAAYCSCFFNDRYKSMPQTDWFWQGSAFKFMDAETAAMICPRPLFIEFGLHDDVFLYENAINEKVKLQKYYDELGISDRLVYSVHDGGHIVSPGTEGAEFLIKHLFK